MQLKIIAWNIQGAASLCWNNSYTIKPEVVRKLINEKADVIVLTEFVISFGIENLFNEFNKKGFCFFQSTRTAKNGVLIAIKKNLIKLDALKIYDNDVITSEIEGCNILRVRVPLKSGKYLNVIGCRMETGKTKEVDQENYNHARENFDNILIPSIGTIQTEDLYIVVGDFNNAKCWGDLNFQYDSQDYENKAQVDYNLNIIKDAFDKIGLTMIDKYEDGTALATYKKYFPLDHIFVYGLRGIDFGTTPSDDLSDHDILWANVILENGEK